MKQTNLCILALFIAICASSQIKNESNNTVRYVKVKDWGEKLFMFPPNYWDNKEAEIAGQIGKEEFEKVKTFSHYQNIPSQMQIFNGQTMVDRAALYKKMDRLRLQHIATFTHYTTAGINRGEFAILKATYRQNIDWDLSAKWDSIYFVISSSQIMLDKS